MAERSFDGLGLHTGSGPAAFGLFVCYVKSGLNQQIFDSNIGWNFCSYVLVSELPYVSDPMIDPILLATSGY